MKVRYQIHFSDKNYTEFFVFSKDKGKVQSHIRQTEFQTRKCN